MRLDWRHLCLVTAALLSVQASGDAGDDGRGERDSRAAQPAAPIQEQSRELAFEVEEATWSSLDVSPSGHTIVLDVLGDLYEVPIDGGEARSLTNGVDWDQMPRFSPDGKQVAFISDRLGGQMGLWTMSVDGSNARRISTDEDPPLSSPAWAPDGSEIITRAPGGLRRFSLATGTNTRVGTPALIGWPNNRRLGGPVFSPDGRHLYYSATTPGRTPATQVERLDLQSGVALQLTGTETQASSWYGGGFRPRVSPDGRLLAYARFDRAATALYVRDLLTGTERRLHASITRGLETFNEQDMLPGYAFTPDGKAVVLVTSGKIHRLEVATSDDRVIPFRASVKLAVAARVTAQSPARPDTVRAVRWPRVSPDGSRLVFTALGRIWSMHLPAGAPRRLTTSLAREYMPAISPDGATVAYVTWSDHGGGHVMVAGLDGGAPRQLTTMPGRYAHPSWSRDGSRVVFVTGSGIEMRGGQPEDDPYLDVQWCTVSDCEPRTVLQTTFAGSSWFLFYPNPVFNADATRILFPERRSDNGTERVGVSSVRLDGSDRRLVSQFAPVQEVAISPVTAQLAVVQAAQVRRVTATEDSRSADPRSAAAVLIPLQGSSGFGVSWQDEGRLTWAQANVVYRWSAQTGTVARIADVRLAVPVLDPTIPIAFVGARVITMDGERILEHGTVVVRGNRIAALGRSDEIAVPAGAKVIDVAGKTIVPGLIDVHAHMHSSGRELPAQSKWEYVANLAYGVTTVFDPSADNLDVFSQAEMVDAGEMIGPRVYSSGEIVYPFADVAPAIAESIESLDHARAVVSRRKGYGAIMIKEYLQPRRRQRQWLAAAAREQQINITAETRDLVTSLTLVADGYTAFEHGLDVELYDDVVQFIARSGVHYTPTLMSGHSGASLGLYSIGRRDLQSDTKLRRVIPPEKIERWRRYQHVPADEWQWRTIARGAAAIARAGGKVSVGAHGQQQGIATHWELWGLQAGGLTPFEALREATIVGAEKLGLDADLGALKPGMLADFLVLSANPLKDIENTMALEHVVANGVVYDASSVDRLWPGPSTFPGFSWQRKR